MPQKAPNTRRGSNKEESDASSATSVKDFNFSLQDIRAVVKEELNLISQNVDTLVNENMLLKDMIINQQIQIEQLESQSRSRNIIISGVIETNLTHTSGGRSEAAELNEVSLICSAISQLLTPRVVSWNSRRNYKITCL